VEWWPLNETSGTAVSNIISPHPHPDPHNGNSKPAAIGAGGPTPVTGMVGGALNFDGASTYVEVPDDTGTLSFGNPTDNFSIDAWIKVAPQDKSGVRPIVDKRVQIGNRVWGYALFLSSGRLGFQLADGAADNLICDSGPPTPTSSCTNYISNVDVADGAWRHVGVTVQRTGKAQVALYVNGSPIFTGVTRAGNANNNASLLIGRGYPIVIPTPYFKGAIDELEIFSRALTQDEITAIFAAGSAGKCKPIETPCCEFELRLFNNAPPNTINKIRIVPVDPSKIIHIRHEDAQEELEDDPGEPDPTEYKLQQVGSSYEITHISGFIPADPNEMIDEEFTVRVNASTSIRVEWVDANGQILKSEQIALNCDDPGWVKEDYPWQDNTTTITGAQYDHVLFAGAEHVECDPDVALMKVQADCSFGSTITSCNQLDLTAPSVSGANTYEWNVGGSSYTGQTVTHTLTGSGSQKIEVTLTAKDSQNVEVCSYSQTIDYCIPPSNDVDFDASAPEADCNGTQINGYKVTFTPKASACNVTSYQWDFGDQTAPVTGTGSPSAPTHTYANTGSYNATLRLDYENGCPSQTKTQGVSIDPKCKPKFKVEYQWCLGPEQTAANIQVICDSQSNKFCQTNYSWDFNDGNGFSQNQTHTYPALTPGTVETITHRMLDADICPIAGPDTDTSCKFPLNPIANTLTVTTCDDGNVIFDSSCPYNVKWSGIQGVDKITDKHFTKKLDDGTYIIICECYDEQAYGDNTVTAKCVKRQGFTVKRGFCKIKEKHHAEQQIGNDLYRMKYKFKAKFENFLKWDRALVVSRTKLKVQKSRKIFGVRITYWRGAKADQIIAGFEGTFRQNQTPTGGCRGSTQVTNLVVHDTRSNAKKAKKRSTGSYLIHRDDSPVKSVHEVTIGGTVWRVELKKLANSCSIQ
jgi:hypothetical protein